MNRSFRIIILKIISTTAIFSFLYPVFLLIRLLLFRQEATLWEALYNYVIILSGFTFGFAIVGDGNGKIRKLIAILAVVVPGVVSALIYLENGIGRGIFETILCFIVYFFGLRAFLNSFDFIVYGKTNIIGAALILRCMILCITFSVLSSAKPFIFLLAHVYMGAVLLLSNQSGIDDAFTKRHIDHANIPVKMRRYNTFLIIRLYLIIAILINIKALVGGISAFLKAILYNGSQAVLWILIKLASMMNTSNSDIGSSGQQGQMMPDLGDETGNKIIPIILNIFFVVFSLIAIYLIMKQMPRIIKNITAKLKAVYTKLVEFLKRFLKVSKEFKIEEDDYHDEIQTLKIKENGGKKHRIMKKQGTWRKGLRGITDPAEKIKYIYITILNKLAVNNIIIQKADTTREILAKAKKFPEIIPYFGDMTKVYEELKYGEVVPNNASVKETEENLNRINLIINNLKNS